jgi:hypothetical protein
LSATPTAATGFSARFEALVELGATEKYTVVPSLT